MYLRTILLVLSTLFFLFALFSGAEPGLQGVINNFPNTLPWLVLLLINVVVIYNKIIGGSLLILFSIFLIFFFGIIENQNWITFIIFILPLLILGMLFIIKNLKSTKK